LAEGATDRALEKRRRVLEAARGLILREGLRGTTMEAIAREAGIAKATLYAQFPDKTAVFAGIVDTLLDQLDAAFRQGLAGQGGAAERIGAALAGQYRVLALALEGSPHAAELMSEHKRSGLVLREQDQAMSGAIAEMLRAAGAEDAEALTQIVVAGAYGIALKIRDVERMDAGIRLLCRRLIGPETGAAG
jgi:Transcriptional regulator